MKRTIAVLLLAAVVFTSLPAHAEYDLPAAGSPCDVIAYVAGTEEYEPPPPGDPYEIWTMLFGGLGELIWGKAPKKVAVGTPVT